MRPNLREALKAVLQEEEAIVREDIEDVEGELMEEELLVGKNHYLSQKNLVNIYNS